jgi:hypothetical protein
LRADRLARIAKLARYATATAMYVAFPVTVSSSQRIFAGLATREKLVIGLAWNCRGV